MRFTGLFFLGVILLQNEIKIAYRAFWWASCVSCCLACGFKLGKGYGLGKMVKTGNYLWCTSEALCADV